MEDPDQVNLDYTGLYPAVLIMGPAGAGKGTVSRVLAQAGSMVHLSTGDIFRAISPDLPAGQLVRHYADQGILVPDEVTLRIWDNYVRGLIATNRYLPQQQLLLLDGIPRTMAQAKLLADYVEVQAVIKLQVDNEDELIRRLKKRAIKEGRADDADDAVLRKRLDVYHKQTKEVLNFYPADKLIEVNGDQPPLNVLGEILAKGADALSFTKEPLQAG